MQAFRLRAYLLLIIGAIISGVAGPVVKLTLVQVPPDIFLLYRFYISTLVVILLLPFVKIKIPKKPSVLVDFLLYGFLNSTIALGFLFLGTNQTSLLDMSLLSIFGPILSILVGYFLLHDHITKREKIGIGIAFFGSFIVLIGPFLTHGDGVGQISGNILVFLSLIAGAASAYLVKKLLRQGADPWSLTSVSFIIGFVSLLVFVLSKGTFISSIYYIKSLPLTYHLGVLYMALLSGTLAYYIGNVAQKSIEVSEAAIFAYIPAAISAFLAIILLGDKVSLAIIVGTITILIGIVLAEWKKRRYN